VTWIPPCVVPAVDLDMLPDYDKDLVAVINSNRVVTAYLDEIGSEDGKGL
jgi:hypothetical protein